MANKQFGSLVARACALIFFSSLYLLPAASQAAWRLEPFIETRAAYSDNAEFEDDEDSDFILQLNPGASIRKDEGRLLVRLDYLLQNFYSFNDSDLSSDHSLDAFSTWEAIKDHFFIDAFATITQVLVDTTGTISTSNINNTGNTTDETTVGIEPKWVQRIGGFAEAEVAYLYEVQRFEDESDEDGVDGDIDNSDRQRFLATLRNPDEDDRIDWGLRHQDEKVDFDDSDTVEFKRSQADLGIEIFTRLEIVGSYGYENNDFEVDPSVADTDDTFWDAGFIFGLGEFTALEVRRGERFFGNTWFGDFTIAGSKLAFNATYEEDIGVQNASVTTRTFLDEPATINNDVNTDVPGDRNSVFESKRWDVSGSYRVAKSTFTLSAFDDDVVFLDTLDEEQTTGISFQWDWRLSGVSALQSLIQWQDSEDEFDGIQDDSDFTELSVRYIRALSPKTDFDAGIVYTEGDGDDEDEDFTSYTLDAGLIVRF